MIKLSFQLSLVILLLINNEINAVELQLRKSPSCAFLSNKIYCFGGYIQGSSADSGFYSLDIYKSNNESVQNLSSQWEIITPNNPSNINIGRRDYPQAVALPDGDSYFIQGGRNYIKSVNSQQTIIYNAKTNTLIAGTNYNDANNGGDRQIYEGTAVYIPHLNSVGFYGGNQQHVTPGSNFVSPEGTSTSGLTFNSSNGYFTSYAGFYYLTLYNINSNVFSVPIQYNNPKRFDYAQSVFLHTKMNKIFYIGGKYFDATSGTIFTSRLGYAKTYNTVTSQWLRENIYGNTPTLRRYHTTTMLDNGDDVLLYGGADYHGIVVMDYFYTLNVPLMEWSNNTIVPPDGSTGPRAYHAAVLVNKTSLFIMYGVNRNKNPTNDLLVLDVRNISNITFAARFPFDNINQPPNSYNDDDNKNNKHSLSDGNGIGTGAIAGIAVGCITAGALAIIAIVCLLRRKKRNNLMEVDWDKIDDQFRETNLQPSQQVIDHKNSGSGSPSDAKTCVVCTDELSLITITPDIKSDSAYHSQPPEIPLNATKPDILSANGLPGGTSNVTVKPVKPDFVDF